MKAQDIDNLIGLEIRFTLPFYKNAKTDVGVRKVFDHRTLYHGTITKKYWDKLNRKTMVDFEDLKLGKIIFIQKQLEKVDSVEIIHRKKKAEPKVRGGVND